VVLYGVGAVLVALLFLAVALADRESRAGAATKPTRQSVSVRSSASSAVALSRPGDRAHSGAPRVPRRRPRPVVGWQTAAIATAHTFLRWFDRWLAAQTPLAARPT
jgi:hypothetical protein